jgi:putative heme transporter
VAEAESVPVSGLLPSEATGALPSRASVYRKVLLGMVTGGIFVLIFAKIIPALGSYEDIWAEVKATPTWVVLALLLVAVLILVLATAMMVLPVRGIGPWRAFLTQQGSTAISFTIPGPSGTGARFLMLRSYGVDVEDFSRGTVAVSIWNNVCMLAMPGVAVLLLVAFGGADGADAGDHLVGWSLLAVAVSVGLVAGVAALLRSEGFARWVGQAVAGVAALLRSEGFARWVGQAAMVASNWTLRLLRRPQVSGWPAKAVVLRSNTVMVLRARGLRLTWLTLTNYWVNGILLVLCLRMVGIDTDVLPWSIALATYTVGRLSTVIQVTPGGVGVVEAAYTAAFVAVTSPSLQPTILAGVLIYRGYTYLLPIVVGGFCYLGWRLDHGRGVPVTSGVQT